MSAESSSHPPDESSGDQPAQLAPDVPVGDEVTEGAVPVAPAEPEPAAESKPAAEPEAAPPPTPPVVETPPAQPAAVDPGAATLAPRATPSYAATPAPEPTSADAGSTVADGAGGPFSSDRPERAIGAAFAGGLVLALILKRLAR